MDHAVSMIFFISDMFTRPSACSEARKNRLRSFLRSLCLFSYIWAMQAKSTLMVTSHLSPFRLLKRDYATLVLLVNEVSNLLRLKNLNELLRPVSILILLCNSDDVTIGLCSL